MQNSYDCHDHEQLAKQYKNELAKTDELGVLELGVLDVLNFYEIACNLAISFNMNSCEVTSKSGAGAIFSKAKI